MSIKKSRTVFIKQQLTVNGSLKAKEFMDEFGVSLRTFERDMDYLRYEEHLDIRFDKKKHVWVLDGVYTDYENLDERTIIVNSYMRSILDVMPLPHEVEREVEEAMERNLSNRGRSVMDRVIHLSSTFSKPSYGVVSAIMAAFDSGRKVSFDYTSGTGKLTQRLVDPLLIINYQGTWYLKAYDGDKEEERTFHLSRITNIRISSEKVSLGFDLEKERAEQNSGFGIFTGCDLKLYKIKFVGYAANNMKNVIWHPKQRIEEQEDGSLILTIPAYNSFELISKMLAAQGEAMPISPVSFVEEYKDTLRDMYKAMNKR